MKKGVEKKEDLRINSDMGKLELAGQDIYNFRDGKEPYDNIGEDAEEKNEDCCDDWPCKQEP